MTFWIGTIIWLVLSFAIASLAGAWIGGKVDKNTRPPHRDEHER